MGNYKKASLVTGPDGIRCIYEIEGTSQKYLVSYPFVKKSVTITEVKNQDVRDSLELMGLLKDGKVVHMIERHNIEGRPAQMIAANLIQAFETYC